MTNMGYIQLMSHIQVNTPHMLVSFSTTKSTPHMHSVNFSTTECNTLNGVVVCRGGTQLWGYSVKLVWYNVGTAERGYMEGAIPRYDNQPPPMASVTYVLLKHFSRRVLQIKESLRCKLSLLILHFTSVRILFTTSTIWQFYTPSQSGHYSNLVILLVLFQNILIPSKCQDLVKTAIVVL